MTNALALPKTTRLVKRQSLDYRSVLRGGLKCLVRYTRHKIAPRTLVISERPWFYFLLNIGLNPVLL